MINELLDGIQWGSPEVERMRVWWAGAKGLVGEHDEITAFFRRWLYLFQHTSNKAAQDYAFVYTILLINL